MSRLIQSRRARLQSHSERLPAAFRHSDAVLLPLCGVVLRRPGHGELGSEPSLTLEQGLANPSVRGPFTFQADKAYEFRAKVYPAPDAQGRSLWSLPVAAPTRQAASAITLGILDTALDEKHPAFQRPRRGGSTLRDLCAAHRPSSAIAAHGTRVASLIVGTANGVAPELQVRFAGAAYPVAPDRGAFSRQRLFWALEALAQAGCSVLNLSLSIGADPALRSVLARLRRELGILTIAAAASRVEHPANGPGVIAVLRGDRRNKGAFAVPQPNGAHAPTLGEEILAPGGPVTIAEPGAGYGVDGAPSFASALVAATCARLAAHHPVLERAPHALTKVLHAHTVRRESGWHLNCQPRLP